jgi:ATP-dependent DNA ligase
MAIACLLCATRKPSLYSRLNNSNTKKFPHIAEALTFLPEETVIDGELVALNTEGKPDFNLMQNYKSAAPTWSTSHSISCSTEENLLSTYRS